MMERPPLHQLAQEQRGIVTADQLRAADYTAGRQRHLVSTQAIIRVHRGVYRVPGFPVDHRQRAVAALLLGGEGARVSHRSAAFLLGAPIAEPGQVDLIIGRRQNVRHQGIVAHQPRDRTDLRPLVVDGVVVTNHLRTLLDLGAVCPPSVVAVVLEHFLITGRVSIRSVQQARERHRAKGRRGLEALGQVLAEHRFGTKPPDSVLELAFDRIVHRFGLPRPTFHHRIMVGARTLEPDFTWPRHRLVVEVDGWAYHAGRKQTEEDRERDLLLTSAGWTIVRVTWLKITRRPAWVAGHIRLTLDRLSPAA